MSEIPSGAWVVIGAVVGALAGTGGRLLEWWFRERRQTRRMARALRGELEALLSILDEREYASKMRESASEIRREERISIPGVAARQDFFSVFQAKVAELGRLEGELPAQIAEVYVLMKAIVEDFTSLNEIDAQDIRDEVQRLQRFGDQAEFRRRLQEWASVLDGLADLIDRTAEKVRVVISELRESYG